MQYDAEAFLNDLFRPAANEGRAMLQLKAHEIRWMITRDMPQVAEIDQHCTSPWKAVDFTDALRQREAIGMVVEKNDLVLGYMIYNLEEKQLLLKRIGVHKEYRHLGVGGFLMEKLKSKLKVGGRSTLAAVVRERHLDLQLFLRKCGLTCCLVERGYFCKPDEDGYRMEFCRGED